MALLVLVLVSVLVSVLGSGSGSASDSAARVFGDPHFTGWDGVHFDFTGEPGGVYCMISDSTIHINMRLVGEDRSGGAKLRTWIKSIGLLFGSHRLVFSAAATAGIDDSSPFIPHIECDGEQVDRLPYHSADRRVHFSLLDSRRSGLVVPWETYLLELEGVGNMVIKASPEVPELRLQGDDKYHLSLDVLAMNLSSSAHGILGQTFLNARGRLHGGSYKSVWNRELLVQQVEGENGDGYLDGTAEDYQASDLLHSDCKFSRFDTAYDFDDLPLSQRAARVISGYARKVFPGGFLGLR